MGRRGCMPNVGLTKVRRPTTTGTALGMRASVDHRSGCSDSARTARQQ